MDDEVKFKHEKISPDIAAADAIEDPVERKAAFDAIVKKRTEERDQLMMAKFDMDEEELQAFELMNYPGFKEFIRDEYQFITTLFGFHNTVSDEDWNCFKTLGKRPDVRPSKEMFKKIAENKTHEIGVSVYSLMEDWSGVDLDDLSATWKRVS